MCDADDSAARDAGSGSLGTTYALRPRTEGQCRRSPAELTALCVIGPLDESRRST
jgi:hypothetical protein